MRKVTAEEIKRLYEFTRKHYVEYYDVQTELVDHLASAMEKNWEEEPGLSFWDNLQLEFRKFGVFGFMEVVERKTKAMSRRYFQLIGKEMKLQLQRPGVAMFGIVFFLAFLLLLKHGSPVLLGSVLAGYFVIIWYLILKSFMVLRRKRRAGEKIYLLETALLNSASYFQFSYIPFQVLIYTDLDFSNHWVQALTSLFCVFMLFAAYVCIYVLPGKRDEILREHYPELKFEVD